VGTDPAFSHSSLGVKLWCILRKANHRGPFACTILITRQTNKLIGLFFFVVLHFLSSGDSVTNFGLNLLLKN
jgi:hypothetical protein